MKHTDIKELLKDASYIGTEVTVCGWLRTSRSSKNILFYEINDGTSLANLQVVFDKETFADIATAEQQGVGAAVKIEGKLVPSEGGNQKAELKAEKLEVLGVCPTDYPLQKKKHSLEFLRTIAHLRARTNTFSAVFIIRHHWEKIITIGGFCGRHKRSMPCHN